MLLMQGGHKHTFTYTSCFWSPDYHDDEIFTKKYEDKSEFYLTKISKQFIK